MQRRKLLTSCVMIALLATACANSPEDTGDADPVAAETEADPEPTGEETSPPADDGPYAELARAEAGEFDGTTVTLLSQWVEAEGDNFEATLADFEQRTGIEIAYDGISDYETVLNVRVEGGDPPDIAQLAQPGLMREFASAGHLVELTEFMPEETLQEDYPAWIDLTRGEDGGIYGLFFRANGKSIVWYPPAAFSDAGYEVPETWDDLMALSQQIVDDGNGAPWCLTQEHGDATGWVATDWVEDVLLRQAGPEVYDEWVAHEIPFDAPEVQAALDTVGEVFFTEGWVYGGTTSINSTFVGDAMNPMFNEEGPQCWLHKQAAWIPDFWPKDADEQPIYTPGEDAEFFFLPPMGGEAPMLGGGDMFVAFDDRPEVRAVMQYLATPEAAQGWIEAGGFLSANADTPSDWYSTYADQRLSEIFAGATAVRFDASDSMPAEVGQGSFWSGMVNWIGNDGANGEQMLAEVEASWPTD